MKKLTTLFILSIILIATQTFAQTYLVPKFTVDVTAGYGAPLGDFKVDVPPTTPLTEDNRADADFFPYYTKQLFHFGADGKLALGKMGNARVTLGLQYNMFTNNTNAIFRIDSKNTLAVTTFKPKVNVITVSLGGEWAFSPKERINPFVGAALAANFFGGQFEFGREVRVKGAQRTGPMDMKSETRIGLIFDGGLNYRISPQIGAIVGMKYHIINIAGKGADNESEIGANEIDLGDKAHLMDDGTTSTDKTLSSFSGYAGISFYFGMRK